MKKNPCGILAAAAAAAASALFYYSFTKWIPALFALSVVLYALAAGLLTARFAQKKALLRGILAGGIFAAAFFALTYLINNVLLHETHATLAAALLCGITLLFFLLYFCILSRGQKKSRVLAGLSFGLAAACALGSMAPAQLAYYYRTYYKNVVSPVVQKETTQMERQLIQNADFYVSPDGDDGGDGSFTHPFATFKRAQSAVRALDKTGRSGITVAVKAGEYRVNTLNFSMEDGGTADSPVYYRAFGDGEVILNGGITLPREAFKKAGDDIASRLPDGAKEHVLAVDLYALGVTAEQIGRIYAIGGYNTAGKYDGDYTGEIWCELFVDDQRQTIARYPNGSDLLYTGEVVKEGQGRESASAALKEGFEELRNPEPDVYKIDKALSERIASWKTLDDVWMFGYWRYDWADASTLIGNVDHENLTLSPKFVSSYGAKKGAPYYFFNVLEELDAPGEWYLDRDSGILYFYPPEDFGDNSCVELSLSKDNVLCVEADHLTFDGFTVKCTRGDAVQITGNGNTVENCLIKNVAGNALLVSGYDNLIVNNEITRTGKGGVILDGGDRETLKPGSNRAENNLVHDWSEIYETYQPAFSLNGVGNVCAHNDMFNSPHEAVTYSGNNHVIEYNLIHDVNLKTDDGGAIYSGRRWDWYGTVIRYNLIYDLGANGYKPVGIYMDDALAGQTIYGNLIINAPHFGIQLGGGQDLDVHDNIVVNASVPISFDDRGLSGLSGNEASSFYQHYKENGELWKNLWDSPWESEVWRKAYPQYEHYNDDFSNTDDPDFVLNPGHGTVTHNLLISAQGTIGEICDNAYKYSEIEENATFKLSALKTLFVDPENGDYTLRADAPIGFAVDVPAMSAFGRQ